MNKTINDMVREVEEGEGEIFTFTIEATGLDGWMSYRYQYKAGAIDRFGYAETREEALKNIQEGTGE